MPRGKKRPDRWAALLKLISEYADAARADEMKGGGDPDMMPLIEKELELAELRLLTTLNQMKRDCECP